CPLCCSSAGAVPGSLRSLSSRCGSVETEVEYDAPVLAIRRRCEELYVLSETPVGYGFEGRGFDLAKDSDGTHYGTFIAHRGHDFCDCIGFSQHGRGKHVDAVRYLIEKR